MSRKQRKKLVHVHDHAQERYWARGGRGNLRKIVEGKLRYLLKTGVSTTSDLIVEVPVAPHLKALCTPKETGGWLCFTVLEQDWHIV
jgi:hypothetical protein